jgi:ABC-2 type transport system ATP-binding protein
VNEQTSVAPLLEVQDLRKSYGWKQVLDGVSVRFPVGLTLLTGPSGAGKSTLLRLLATAESPSGGRLRWKGKPLPGARRALRQVLGYAPQSVELPEDLTAREFALHMAALKGLELKAAERQFLDIASDLGLLADIHRKIGTFSGGMQRRLVFAQALLGTPELLILDEPTAELDRERAARVGAIVVEHSRRAIVLMTTHLADELSAQATAVMLVGGGRVIAV